jgi:preprotein translocase subunit SecE
MAKQKQGQGGGGSGTPPGKSSSASSPRQPVPPSGGKRQRVGARQFLREVRQELKKVDWPTRQELIAYTIVVLVSVVVLTSFVFVLDYIFSKFVLKVFGN